MGTPSTAAFDVATALVAGSISGITTMTGTSRDTFYNTGPLPKQVGVPHKSTWCRNLPSPDLISTLGGRTANVNICWVRVECRGAPKQAGEPYTRIVACRDLLHKSVAAALSAYNRVWVGRQPFELPPQDGCHLWGIDVELWKEG